MPGFWFACRIAAGAAVLAMLAGTANAQIMIVGNDQKPGWDENGKPKLQEPGHDTLSIIDMSKPDALRMIATIPLDNSIVGPPTNLAVSPDRSIALVANSVNGVKKDDGFALASDNRLFVIDLKANPPAVSSTVTVGKRPSGLAISADGKSALVTNRDEGTISVLAINGKDVKVTDTVSVGEGKDQVSAVAITPDGKTALAAKSAANKIAVLAIKDGKVTYGKQDVNVGVFPYNVAITPNGLLALTANNGNGGTSDGSADTVSVIDLQPGANRPPHVIDHITVGDSTEGLVISPNGDLAVSIEARGSNLPKSTWFHHPTGVITILKIDGKNVSAIGERLTGVFPEGGVFSADGSHLYVGNFISQNLSVFKVDGDDLTEAGVFKLPGHPASMRGGPQ